MPNIKFEIDKVRGDSFYHYKKYIDGQLQTDKSGSSARWGLYSSLKTEDEQKAWLSAVSQFNSENDIETPCAKIKKELEKFKESLAIDEEQFPEKQSYLMPALQAAVDAAGGVVGICSDDYIDTLMKACGGALPTKENMLKYATEAFENNLTLDVQILMNSLMKLGVSAFIDPLISGVEGIIDSFFGTLDLIYNEVARKYATVLQLYRKWSSDILNLDKEKAKELFIAELKKLSAPIQEFISYFLTIDALKGMIEMLKSIKTIGQNICNSVFTKFNNLKETLKAVDFPNKNQLLSLLNTLLFALGGFVGAMFAARCAKEKEIDAAIESLVAAEKVNNEDELYDKVVNKEPKIIRNQLIPYTVIYNSAVNNKNDYSLYGNYNNNIIIENANLPKVETPKNILDCLCKVSMCETIDDTDTTDWTNWLARPVDIIIEFDKRLHYSITVNIDQQIKLNDPIAYISGTVVKARDEFKVIEKGSNYIIGKYQSAEYDDLFDLSETDTNVISLKAQALLQKKIEEFSTNDVDKIIDEYKKLAHVKTFIRDYISYFKFPELARYTKEYSSGDAASISTDKFIELYEKKADKIIENHGKDLKKSCKKKNLQPYIDSGNMTGIKDMIEEKNNQCLEDILTLWNNNPGQMKYCSEGRICDFMLYSHYVEYLYSDKFEYDEDNPYIVKLHDKLNYFIGRRTRLELNKDNLDDLIESFNEACDSLLKVYWKYPDITYYDHFSDLFKYDTYTNTELISEGTVGDSISLYRRLQNYIKSLIKFEKKDEYADVDVINCSDYNKLLEEQSKDEDRKVNKEQEKIEKEIKKIVYRFVSLRRIELSLNDTDLTTYIDKEALNKFESLKKSKGDIIYNYDDKKKYTVKDALYGTKSILDPYLQVLKKLTDEEANELRTIINDAKNYYYDNNDRLNSCEDLFALGEYNWPLKSTIYRKNEPKDYYLFSYDFVKNSPVPKNFDELKELEKQIPILDAADDELLNLGCSPKTQIGIDNILYWLKYCGIATIVNCMLPMYWGTGIIIPSKIPIPIIYIPIIPIKVGSMVIVIGIGLCGMFPWPMILFVNPGAVKASIIIPITLAVDYITKMVQQIPGLQKPAIETVLSPLIKAVDSEINECIQQDEEIKYQQEQIKNATTDYEISRRMDTMIGLDTTSKAVPNDTVASSNLEETSNISDFGSIFETHTIENVDDLIKEQDNVISELTSNHFSYTEDSGNSTSYSNLIASGEIDQNNYAKQNITIGKRKKPIQYICVHYTAGTTSTSGAGKNTCEYWNDVRRYTQDDIDNWLRDNPGQLINNCPYTINYPDRGCADFVVDDEKIYQYNPNINAYYTAAVGDKLKNSSKGGGKLHGVITNSNSISIEICSNLKSGYTYKNTLANSPGWYFTDSSIANAKKLIISLMKEYNIDIEHIYRHWDVSGKCCPGVIGWNPLAENENSWIEFKNSL